ncbi:hypothetical protein JOC34_002104 [Virgibacillus halotolerans]|uniref:YusW family protein n=1 Tax=Virgibacillus halotolerans TaxID=1071053 RepID=UPI0019607657|nr:YusW family protein [Virgibacillus halotolerans]MBM7599736.1 hypothetical protein [Virgibacillus halotolerans]
MKRILLLASMFIVAITLVACGDTNNNDDTSGDQDTGMENNEDQDNDADENADDNQADNGDTATDNAADNNDNDDMKQKMDELDYTDFELEVDYGKNKEYEAEIEQDNGKVEADLEDELNGDDVNGQEAFDKIYPNVKKLTIDQNTEKADAIQQTLDAFDLDSDYVKFEVEITFKDGTKVEFEDKN